MKNRTGKIARAIAVLWIVLMVAVLSMTTVWAETTDPTLENNTSETQTPTGEGGSSEEGGAIEGGATEGSATEGGAVEGTGYSVQKTSLGNEVSAYVSVDGETVSISGMVTVTSGVDENSLVFTGADNIEVPYTISNGTLKIEGSSSAELVLNIQNANSLTSLQIEAEKVSSTVEAIELSGAAVAITAGDVSLHSDNGATLKVGSLAIKLEQSTELVVSKMAAKRLTASFSKFNVEATGKVEISASVSETELTDEETDEILG